MQTVGRCKIQVWRESEYAHLPTRAYQTSAGLDLKSAYKYTIPARGSKVISTDLIIKVPSGTYGRIASRSSLAAKQKIHVGAGVIDPDFRGIVMVVLFNLSDDAFEITPGLSIAQLICEKIEIPEVEEVLISTDTARGIKGFGSSDRQQT